ncbi:MAG: hypothetical protein ABFD29_01850 [Anaerolineaceae bacterium]
MATYTKQKLSGSTDGKPISITATSTPGTVIHTAVAGTSNFDEIWLWAQNNGTTDVLLTVEFGSADAVNNIIVSVPYKSGMFPIIPGLILQNGATVKAFAGTTAVVSILGFVNNIAN